MKMPSDKELINFAVEMQFDTICYREDFLEIAKAVLTKWGHKTAQVPVAELIVDRFDTKVKLLEAGNDVRPYGTHLLYVESSDESGGLQDYNNKDGSTAELRAEIRAALIAREGKQ